MPEIVINRYSKLLKKGVVTTYDTDKATFICSVPEGRLLKKPRKCNFYVYNPAGKTKKDQIRELTWNEARDLIKTYGTREQYCKYFSILNADGSYKDPKKKTHIAIDEYHRVKLLRNASLLSMSMSQFVMYLIDKYDDNKIYNNTYHVHRDKGRFLPSGTSEFTS